ncbi:MAG: hypothetical protein Q6J68_07395 [Thermostichales cyanobacterium SZTDM-1c_bins_54]
MAEQPALEDYLRAIEWGMEKGAYQKTRELVQVALGHYPGEGQLCLWEAILTQALGDTKQAIVLAERLLQHPQRPIRQDAKRFLTIWRAPQLRRSESWLVQIPELTAGNAQPGRVVSAPKPPSPPPTPTPAPTGSSYSVIWFLLGAVAVVTCLGSLLGFVGG